MKYLLTLLFIPLVAHSDSSNKLQLLRQITQISCELGYVQAASDFGKKSLTQKEKEKAILFCNSLAKDINK